MTQHTHFDILRREGFTENQIDYLNQCSKNPQWEECDIQRRWISAISDMSRILYEWNVEHQSHLDSTLESEDYPYD